MKTSGQEHDLVSGDDIGSDDIIVLLLSDESNDRASSLSQEETEVVNTAGVTAVPEQVAVLVEDT